MITQDPLHIGAPTEPPGAPHQCLICGKPVPDFEPVYCCSARCDRALFNGIGMPMEQRRVSAGISKWSPPSECGISAERFRELVDSEYSAFEQPHLRWIERNGRMMLLDDVLEDIAEMQQLLRAAWPRDE